MVFSGPISFPKESDARESIFNRSGGHYNIFKCRDEEKAWEFLVDFFEEDPDQVDDLNFVLFSTSGVHGSYRTLEDIEESFNEESKEDLAWELTFVLVQPRLGSMTYGNVNVKKDRIDFLKKLRQNSWDIVRTIGTD